MLPDCFLLDGVPGSGKTDTYFETVQTCLDEGKQVLILLPEIALTPDWEKRFYKRFSFNPLIWHSEITKKKKERNLVVCIKRHCKNNCRCQVCINDSNYKPWISCC